jgi:hypothetical protein
MGRSAILGEQRNNYFCDVACGRGEMVSSFPLSLCNAEVATVLGSIPASPGFDPSILRHRGAADEAVLKEKNPKNPPVLSSSGLWIWIRLFKIIAKPDA